MGKRGNMLFRFVNWSVRQKDRITGHHRHTPKSLASRGEEVVAQALTNLGIKFQPQYRLGYCYHVDFACWNQGKLFLIEYDGPQHYRPRRGRGGMLKYMVQRVHDRVERLECNSRGIPLLRIKYNVPYSRIESLIKSFCQKEASERR